MKNQQPDNPQPGPAEGLICPQCHCAHLPVVYTRHQGSRVKRLRECRNCGKRITTYERIPGA